LPFTVTSTKPFSPYTIQQDHGKDAHESNRGGLRAEGWTLDEQHDRQLQSWHA